MSINAAVADAVETMKAAERVIDGLMAVNARLRRENFAMLEALEVALPYLDDGTQALVGEVAQIKAAIKLAKGESHQ